MSVQNGAALIRFIGRVRTGRDSRQPEAICTRRTIHYAGPLFKSATARLQISLLPPPLPCSLFRLPFSNDPRARVPATIRRRFFHETKKNSSILRRLLDDSSTRRRNFWIYPFPFITSRDISCCFALLNISLHLSSSSFFTKCHARVLATIRR